MICKIENADPAITRDVRPRIPTVRIANTCHDLKNVVVSVVASWKKNQNMQSVSIIADDFSLFRWRRLDWTRDIVRRRIRSVSRSWTLIHGKDTTWNWRPDGRTRRLFVAMRGLDECYERAVKNVSRDRLKKVHYSDHVKSQYSVILRHVTWSWIYFIK